ncbi:translocation/assembly module TamB domain-containing protein [Cyclobacterium sp. 1_MG-2023]|uniref:translocation/assembly module TamB domain-containing protein n=1 Tax=Cyclobacterium sp. 1_MG-2023 TaxID=3062681 RepID=UPI0026E436D4|nr:translocation/assembly module TamB domain-containing protein [Cyclobacterium sp. 1_MG-2023]MDO6438478.1 translocation/assembly module TamB domain-containing protein [Cyclobacterium sp. 1_MG-2023]
MAHNLGKKIFKIGGWILLGLGLLVLIILLFVRSPFGQDIIVDKATQYLAEKTNSKVSIDKLYLTFRGNLYLEGLYLEQPNGDTLVYSNKLETGLELLPYLLSSKINVSRLEWEGLKANIERDSTGAFNFDYLMEAFVSEESNADTTAVDTLSSKESSYPDINIGPVNLEDWNLQFTDKVLGLTGSLNLGKLSIAINGMDLNKMDFNVTEILWENSALTYQQFKPLPVSEGSSESDMPMPLLVLDKLSLKNIKADYHSLPDGMKIRANMGDFLLEMPEANLDKQKVLIKRLSLQDSQIEYQSETKAEEEKKTVEKEDAVAPFVWPVWEVELSSIDLSNNQINYGGNGVQGQAGEFNSEDVGVKDFILQANNLYYKPKKAGFSLDKLGFTERSGFKLENFQAQLVLNDSSLQVNELSVNTGQSGLKGDFDLEFPSLVAVMDNPEKASMALAIQNVNLGVEDAYYFSPSLENNSYLKTFEKKSFEASLLASGNLNKVRLKEVAAKWGRSTSMDISGTLSNPLDTDRLSWDLDEFKFISTEADLNLFTPEDSLGIKYPQNLDLSVSSAGSLDDFNLEAILKAYNASVALAAELSTEQGSYNFDLNSTISAVPLGKIMGDTLTYGALDMELAAHGKVGPLDSLDLSLDSKLINLVYNGHNYKGLQLSSEIVDGEGQFKVNHKDEMLDMDLLAKVSLTPSNYKVDMDLALKGADLYGLNFSAKKLRTQFSLNAAFEGKPENFELQSQLTDGTIVLDEQAYPMGGMDLALRVLPDSTDFSIQSNVLNGFLQSNVSPGETYEGLSRHFNGYFLDSASLSTEQVSRPVNVDMDFTIPSTLLLQRVILPGLEELEEGSIKMTFNEKKSKLDGRINFPYLSYSGAVLDSLDLNVLSDSSNFDFDFGVMGLSFGRLAIGPTYFSGEVLENQLYVNFNALHDEEVLTNIDFDLGFGEDSMQLHINPEGLIFNKLKWEVAENNAFTLAKNKVFFEAFEFSREKQLVSFGNEPEENSIDLTFNDFRLRTFTSLLNPEEILAAGLVNGAIKIENPFGATGLQADLTVQDMALLKVPLGNLTLEASGNDQKNYDFDLMIKDKGVDLDLTGGFVADPLGAKLNLALDLNKFELDMLDGLTAGAISDGNGFISGKFKVEGSSSDPIYSGNLAFNETEFTVATLNARFAIDKDEIRVDNQGVYLDQLTIKDDQDNNFVLDGDIITENDFINPQFDLSLTADNFKVLNSTQEDNDLFYGDALIGADVTIQGDLNLPVIDAEITVDKGTNLSVVIPESQLDVVERQGIVTFVNRENPEDILTKRLEETSISGFTGYKVDMLLNVSSEAVFNLVIDERSGDNLMVEGAADLQLNMDPNGRVTLTGIYELSKGHYELSLYNLVSKRFEIQEGSTISWAGDPMDANMDITAIYSVKTSASDLMTATASGGSRETMSKYRQEFSFIVYLNIDGELLKPEISFTMDMPEDERGALGGAVYAQVKQLNNQEGELNRQVFSLLVLNSFFPSGDSSGSGGTTAMAKSSVSQLLSGQLNTFTNSLVGDTGLELDVGLDSFEDYQGDSPQSRTQLNVNASKRFLDDRLIVQVGSQIDIEGSSSTSTGNSLLGNVSVEYLITENGRYRARGFRKNQFESFIDGQLVVTGLSVIFNREFNEFEDLWRGIDSRRKEQDNQAEEERNEK